MIDNRHIQLGIQYAWVPFALFGVYCVYTAFWRLYLSPIAHIPGPKIAALTRLYEGYYDIYLGGQYMFKVKEMHEKYGPILRISPWEVHIADPDFYDTIYASATGTRRVEKYDYFTKSLGLDHCSFATVDHDQHRVRRSALLPYFSNASIRGLQNPVIQERCNVLLRRMSEFRGTNQAFNASAMSAALTNDVINIYSFARCDHRLEDPSFDSSSRDAALGGVNQIHLLKRYPWINDVTKALPESFMEWVFPAFASFLEQQRTSGNQVKKIMDGQNGEWKDKEHPTIFHAVLNSKLPPHEKTFIRMQDDAQMLVMAGTLTTAMTLEVIIFWLLKKPDVLRKLKDELRNAIPTHQEIGTLSMPQLESLTYLSAVIKEGLRLSYGASARLQRVNPDNEILFTDKSNGKQYVIPPKTPVGMTSVIIHHNENCFPDSHNFIVDRWLAPDAQKLDKYLVSFSKGSRICFGRNLGYGMLYVVLSCMWRQWGSMECKDQDDIGVLRLHDTELKDVEVAADYFVPRPRKESVGVQVKAYMNTV